MFVSLLPYGLIVFGLYILIFKLVDWKPKMKYITSINLGEFSTSNVLVKAVNGDLIKRETHFNRLIREYYIVQVIVPKNIMAINPSFLEEFIYDAVYDLGTEEFKRRIKFRCEGQYDIERDLQESIDRITLTKTYTDVSELRS